MSTTGFSDYKKPSYMKNISGELDVFEAARYFSGYNDNSAPIGDEKVVIREATEPGYLRQGRASLDMPTLKHHQYYYKQYDDQRSHATVAQPIEQQHQQQPQQQQQMKEKKKCKQPSSPGGKLAHFLNSLFTQTMTSKKSKMSTKSCSSTRSMKDEDESPSSRRKRRFSISHFRSSNSVIDSKSIYSSSSSGFRTPPPYTLNTPTKCYNDIRSYSDYNNVLATLSKYKDHDHGHDNVKNEKIKGGNLDWMDEKTKLKSGFVENSKNCSNNHGYQEKKSEIEKFHEEVDDDGADSDTSSDLFELQIDYDFGFCSSGLPVYETTHMDSLKISSSAQITNGPIRV